MKNILLVLIGVLCIESTYASEDFIVKYNLKTNSGTIQNVSTLSLEQIKEVSNQLESESLETDNKKIDLLLNYIQYYKYIKESLGQYPGPNLKKTGTSTRYLENYDLAKSFTNTMKFTFGTPNDSGLLSDENAKKLQVLLPNLGEAEDPMISWKYSKRVNIPVLEQDESVYIFVNKEQDKVAGCIKVNFPKNITGPDSVFIKGSESEMSIAGDDSILTTENYNQCKSLKTKSTNIDLTFNGNLLKLLEKQKLILENKALFLRYVGTYTKSYDKTLKAKSIEQLEKVNFLKLEEKIMTLSNKNTKRIKLIQLYSLEEVFSKALEYKKSLVSNTKIDE